MILIFGSLFSINAQVRDTEEESRFIASYRYLIFLDLDISYQNMNEELTTDTNKIDDFIRKRQSSYLISKRQDNEQLLSDIPNEIDNDETFVNGEAIHDSLGHLKDTTNQNNDKSQLDKNENIDVDTSEQLENVESNEKNEETSKINEENGIIDRVKRVNKAGSSHKNRASLNRVLSTKNKGNSDSNPKTWTEN
uniref:Secreted protein n=1 Tax=Parastrongyloides trichosuri TaxID=131310 RepID=A0A0N4ZCS8_PARTI